MLSRILRTNLVEERHHALLDGQRIDPRLHNEIPMKHMAHEMAAAVRRGTLVQQILREKLIPLRIIARQRDIESHHAIRLLGMDQVIARR